MSKHHRRGADAPWAHADACADSDPTIADRFFSDRPASSLRHQRKDAQLRAAVAHALRATLACDVHDPLLDDLELTDVVAAGGGVLSALFVTRAHDVAAVQARLRETAPLFRAALAVHLARKRVPIVTLTVLPNVAVPHE